MVTIGALWAVSCGREDKNLILLQEDSVKIQRVEVTNPAYRSFVAEILITGTAKPNREVMLHAMESGYVKAVFKDIGDGVYKGGGNCQIGQSGIVLAARATNR